MNASPKDTLGITITRTARLWRTKLDERLAHLGLTQAKWLVLIHIHRTGGEMSQKDIAQSVGVEGPTMVRVLDGLERIDLVRRVGHEGDRRVKFVRLTDKAGDVIEEIMRIGAGLRAEALTGLSDEDLVFLDQVMGTIFRNLEALAAKDSRLMRT
ncbi:MAG: MarR family transcriptional regulator [Desulfovibrio sp.]